MQPLVISASDAPTDITNLRLVRMIGSIPVHIPASALGLLGNDIGAAVAGDMIYGSAAGTWARLAKGTALQHLRMNSGATAPEWSSYATIESLEGLSLSAGDILYATAADTLARLAKGTAFQVLRQNSALTAPEWSTAREVLTATRTYYVRTDGSDSNNGLANTSGGAFLTVQKAIDTVAALDLSIYNVTISVGAGTFAGAVVLKRLVGAGAVTISGAGATTIFSAGVSGTNAGLWGVSSVTVSNGGGSGITSSGSTLVTFSGVTFGAVTGHHIYALNNGVVQATGNYSISGNAGFAHYFLVNGGVFNAFGITVTLTASITVNTFCYAITTGLADAASMTFTLGAFTVTGTRYSATLNGVISVAGGGANYFPGTVAGATATGGQYA